MEERREKDGNDQSVHGGNNPNSSKSCCRPTAVIDLAHTKFDWDTHQQIRNRRTNARPWISCNRYWYRKQLDQTMNYSFRIRVHQTVNEPIPVGDSISDCWMIVHVLIRARITNVPQDRYHIKWLIWHFDQIEIMRNNPTSERKFQSTTEPRAEESGSTHESPNNLLYNVNNSSVTSISWTITSRRHPTWPLSCCSRGSLNEEWVIDCAEI